MDEEDELAVDELDNEDMDDEDDCELVAGAEEVEDDWVELVVTREVVVVLPERATKAPTAMTTITTTTIPMVTARLNAFFKFDFLLDMATGSEDRE